MSLQKRLVSLQKGPVSLQKGPVSAQKASEAPNRYRKKMKSRPNSGGLDPVWEHRGCETARNSGQNKSMRNKAVERLKRLHRHKTSFASTQSKFGLGFV